MREMFNESQLISELEKIGNNLKRRTKIFDQPFEGVRLLL